MEVTFSSLSRKGNFYKVTEDDVSLKDHIIAPETHPISSHRMLCQLQEYLSTGFSSLFCDAFKFNVSCT